MPATLVPAVLVVVTGVAANTAMVTVDVGVVVAPVDAEVSDGAVAAMTVPNGCEVPVVAGVAAKSAVPKAPCEAGKTVKLPGLPTSTAAADEVGGGIVVTTTVPPPGPGPSRAPGMGQASTLSAEIPACVVAIETMPGPCPARDIGVPS